MFYSSWVGNTGMSCLELVPAEKKLWCQVLAQLGNACTTTGTEGLTVWYAIIWTAGRNLVGFSLGFEGNSVLSISLGIWHYRQLQMTAPQTCLHSILNPAGCFLLWNFSKLVLKSFKTRHHLFDLYQLWKTSIFANILQSFACRLQLLLKSWKCPS